MEGVKPTRFARRLLPAVVMFAVFASVSGTAQAAIAFVGKSSATTATGGATSLALGAPIGVASGEVEICTISLQGTATITPPSGWTQVISSNVGTALSQVSFWHISASSEGTTTWTFSASSIAAGGIVAYSGVDTNSIVDVAGATTGTSGTSATIPSVTTSYVSDFVIGAGSFNNQGALTASSGTTSRNTAHVAVTNGPTSLVEDFTQASAGATAAKTITNLTSATAWIGQAIAIKPASSAGVLSVSSTATPGFSANLDTGDESPTYTVPLRTIASVSPSVGWNETITSTAFSSGTHSLSLNASTIASTPTISCDTAFANCTSATNSVSYPVSVPAGSSPPSAVKFVDAASGTGLGEFTITPTVTVTVPQNSFAGAYTSTLTIAIVSGP